MDLQDNKSDGIVLPVTNTRISASEYNQIAGSLMHIINTAALTPDAGDNAQLLQAIQALAGGGGGGGGATNVPAVIPNFEVFDRSNPYTTTKPEVTLLQEAYSFTADANIRIPNVIAQVNNVTSFDIYTAILIQNNQGSGTDGIISILPGVAVNDTTLRITKNTSHYLRFRVSFLGNGTDDIDITATTALTMATKYYLHISYSSTDGYKVLVKTANDENWTELISSNLTTGISSNADNIDFGRNGASYFRGVVYMRDTYINVNGQRVFNAVNIGQIPMILN